VPKAVPQHPFVTWDQKQPHPKIRLAPEINPMRSNLQRSARTFASNVYGWCNHNVLRLKQNIGRQLRNRGTQPLLSRQSVHKTLPLVGIIAGAVACGLWLNSAAAGVFALILLFLLLSIVKSLDRIAALMRTQSAAPLHSNWRASGLETASQRNIYISAKAMERLRPWVEDESPLTEESAKAYCSVLLDTLAILRPGLAGRAHAEDS
jgi:hypothetical protein